jgi:CHAT domain/Cytosol aminopeptidase family, N-terminal domain
MDTDLLLSDQSNDVAQKAASNKQPATSSPGVPLAVEIADRALVAPPGRHRPDGRAVAADPGSAPPRGKPEKAVPVIHIDVVLGGQTNVKAPVSVIGRYEGLDLAGTAKAFDRQLDNWLTRAIDMGLIGSTLGQLFPLRLDHAFELGRVKVENLLLMGVGEPGQLSVDDCRYLMSNVTVVVKSMRQDHMATPLFGIRRREMPIEHAVRGFLEGIIDGYDRFRNLVNSLTDNPQDFIDAADRPLLIYLVEPNPDNATRIFSTLRGIAENHLIQGLQLEIGAEITRVDPDASPKANAKDTDPEVSVTLMRVTTDAESPSLTSPANPPLANTGESQVFRFSALSDVAAVTVREREVNPYFAQNLPSRLSQAKSLTDQEAFGRFFASYLIPSDFRALVETANNLTFVVDDTTAIYPWEMAAFKRNMKSSFLGTSVGVSRRFHSLLSPPPSSTPPLNRVLKLLLIADPAGGQLHLEQALEEGLAVIQTLNQARIAWQGEYRFELTARLGSRENADALKGCHDEVRRLGDWVQSVGVCDPLEIAMLTVNEQYDVIHYAGHGAFDRKTGRAGWVLEQDCFLTAQEIFQVRQVPRLVFANACFSSRLATGVERPTNKLSSLGPDDHYPQRGHLVGLAQAFFARGIPNYIGAGWQVGDRCARLFAQWFYARILGLESPEPATPVLGTSPPATIGDALLTARRAAHDFVPDSSTWGAYQHYGSVSDKLLPLPNQESSNETRSSD